MRVAIIELCNYTHHSAVLARMDVFQDEGVQIELFINEGVYGYLKDELEQRDVGVSVLREGDSIRKFFKRMQGMVFDQVHIVSMQTKLHHFLLYKPKAKKIYVHIHNINTWLIPEKSWHVRKNVAFLIRKVWLKRVTGVTVGIEKMKETLESYGFTKPIICFPFTLHYESPPTRKKPNKLSLAIPGMVTEERRNYLRALQHIQSLPNKYRKKLRIELLGPYLPRAEAKSNRIKQEVESARKKGITIIDHEQKLHPKTFFEHLLEADALLAITKMDMGQETYGITKETGFTSDMIRSEVPGIIPNELHVKTELENAVIRYKEYADLTNILKELMDNADSLQKYQKRAAKSTKEFSVEKMRQKISLSDF